MTTLVWTDANEQQKRVQVEQALAILCVEYDWLRVSDWSSKG
ncbi:MAG: hypothetical protein VYA30_05225 [Myxococcota bacterium]|nr:hypothetical protein [Myxococcota bacterium]